MDFNWSPEQLVGALVGLGLIIKGILDRKAVGSDIVPPHHCGYDSEAKLANSREHDAIGVKLDKLQATMEAKK